MSQPTPAAARWATYAAAASAAGLASTADAAIVYAGDQDILIPQCNSFNLNLDGDAYYDILRKNYVFGGNYQGATVNYAPGKVVGFTTGLNYATALAAGVTIDAAATAGGRSPSRSPTATTPTRSSTTPPARSSASSSPSTTSATSAGSASPSTTPPAPSSSTTGHTTTPPAAPSRPARSPPRDRSASSPPEHSASTPSASAARPKPSNTDHTKNQAQSQAPGPHQLARGVCFADHHLRMTANMTSHTPTPPRQTSPTRPKRVLLIGWDAADWQLITPLIAQGHMPTLARMIEQGVSGNLASMQPMLSPLLWNSIATGKRPDQHGVHGFTEPDPNAADRKSTRLNSSH